MWLDKAIQWFLPREEHFFDLLEQGADYARQASELLVDCCSSTGAAAREQVVDRIKVVEEGADRVIVEIYKELNRTFVTPIDRSDIYALGTALERITDEVFATSLQIKVHAMDDLPAGSVEMAKLIQRCSEEIIAAVRALKTNKNSHLEIRKNCKTINSLENEGDIVFRTQLAEMFKHEVNAIRLLKHKEFLEGLERALDQCDDVANALASIVIKNS